MTDIVGTVPLDGCEPSECHHVITTNCQECGAVLVDETGDISWDVAHGWTPCASCRQYAVVRRWRPGGSLA